MGGYFQTDDSSPDSHKGNPRGDGDWVTFVVLQLRNAVSLAPIAALV
jgi:hypothetical protein